MAKAPVAIATVSMALAQAAPPATEYMGAAPAQAMATVCMAAALATLECTGKGHIGASQGLLSGVIRVIVWVYMASAPLVSECRATAQIDTECTATVSA